jgi:FkbM family methyltransferase
MNKLSADFLQDLIVGLVSDAGQNPVGNHDDLRFGTRSREIRARRSRERLLELAGRFGWHRQRFNPSHVDQALANLMPLLDGLARSYARWSDDASRSVMLELLRYRILGAEHVRLSTNTPGYWQHRKRVQRECLRQAGATRVGELSLDEFELPGLEGPIRSIQRPIGAATTFVIEQYALRRSGVDIAAAPGDVVLDCGGCWGDTALYFADRVGTEGRVFSFEFDPANLAVFERNLERNPTLAKRIECVRHPLWSRSGEAIFFSPAGPSTAISSVGSGPSEAVTLSIDDFVAERKLDRVDFIKMDIEGAELPALEGARETLRRFHPKLAICAYHKIDDFVTLPDFIEALDCAYEQRLAHWTIHLEETVVFANTKPARTV